MNPRRVVVEDRALALADALQADGQTLLASRLRETVPETFGACDEHVPVLRQALQSAARSLPAHAPAAERVLAALDDLPAHIGRRGRVFVATSMAGTVSAYWEDGDWLEGGPGDVSLEAALEWASDRSDEVHRNDG